MKIGFQEMIAAADAAVDVGRRLRAQVDHRAELEHAVDDHPDAPVLLGDEDRVGVLREGEGGRLEQTGEVALGRVRIALHVGDRAADRRQVETGRLHLGRGVEGRRRERAEEERQRRGEGRGRGGAGDGRDFALRRRVPGA